MYNTELRFYFSKWIKIAYIYYMYVSRDVYTHTHTTPADQITLILCIQKFQSFTLIAEFYKDSNILAIVVLHLKILFC